MRSAWGIAIVLVALTLAGSRVKAEEGPPDVNAADLIHMAPFRFFDGTEFTTTTRKNRFQGERVTTLQVKARQDITDAEVDTGLRPSGPFTLRITILPPASRQGPRIGSEFRVVLRETDGEGEIAIVVTPTTEATRTFVEVDGAPVGDSLRSNSGEPVALEFEFDEEDRLRARAGATDDDLTTLHETTEMGFHSENRCVPFMRFDRLEKRDGFLMYSGLVICERALFESTRQDPLDHVADANAELKKALDPEATPEEVDRRLKNAADRLETAKELLTKAVEEDVLSFPSKPVDRLLRKTIRAIESQRKRIKKKPAGYHRRLRRQASRAYRQSARAVRVIQGGRVRRAAPGPGPGRRSWKMAATARRPDGFGLLYTRLADAKALGPNDPITIIAADARGATMFAKDGTVLDDTLNDIGPQSIALMYFDPTAAPEAQRVLVTASPGGVAETLWSDGSWGWTALGFTGASDLSPTGTNAEGYATGFLYVFPSTRTIQGVKPGSRTPIVRSFELNAAGETGVPVSAWRDPETGHLYVLVERQNDENRTFLYRTDGAPAAALTDGVECGKGGRRVRGAEDLMIVTNAVSNEVCVFVRGSDDRFAFARSIAAGGPVVTAALDAAGDKANLAFGNGTAMRFLQLSTTDGSTLLDNTVTEPEGMIHLVFTSDGEDLYGTSAAGLLLAPDWVTAFELSEDYRLR